MKPYYQDRHTTIYHGSAEEILPVLSPVAAIATDPPYGIGKLSIGIEREERYIEAAIERLQQEYLPLATAPQPKMEEAALL